MKSTTLALALAAVMAVAANPALAGCGGSHGKSHRAASAAKKPAVARAAQPAKDLPAPATSGLDTTSGLAGAVGTPNV